MQRRTAFGVPITLGSVANGLAILWFCYGVGRFFDGPIHPCGVEHYCSKLGSPKTHSEYTAFLFWQRSIFILWPIIIIGGLLTAAWKNRAKIFPPIPPPASGRLDT